MQNHLHECVNFIMNTTNEGLVLEVRALNEDQEEFFFIIEHLGGDEFYLSSQGTDGAEYETETDYDLLMSDFRNDTIIEIKVLDENGNTVQEYNSPVPQKTIPVDYTRKMPKHADECPICFEPLELLIKDICGNKKCKHVFHCGCISQWTGSKEKPLCPVCRRNLDLYKIQDINDYSKTVGFTLFGNSLSGDIRYLQSL